MIALVHFDSYSTDTQRAAMFQFFLLLGVDHNWNVQEQVEGTPIYWTPTFNKLLADTVTKTIVSADGTEPNDNIFDALFQYGTIVNAIVSNSRPTLTIDGILWSFDANGDVYANKKKILSASFEEVSAERALAMT